MQIALCITIAERLGPRMGGAEGRGGVPMGGSVGSIQMRWQ